MKNRKRNPKNTLFWSPKRIGVLADDFSGAADVGLAFWEAGFKTELWAPAGGPPRTPDASVRVWVLDTESRHLSNTDAGKRVRSALQALNDWKPDFVFKKIDSTLRGPLGAEMTVFLDQEHGPLIPVVPAFPKMGRTVENGCLYVDGVPLHRSPFARDPRHPTRSSGVEKRFNFNNNIKKTVWVPDVKNDRDLNRVARSAVLAFQKQKESVRLAVGSGGFAGALACLLGNVQKKGGSPFRALFRDPSPEAVGFVVGSVHPLSRDQTRRLLLRHPDVLLIQSPVERSQPKSVLHRLIAQTRVLEKKHKIRRWVVTGGETAFALVRRWGVARWVLVGRVEPGIALCRSLSAPRRWLVPKPGGFGTPDFFKKALKSFPISFLG